MVENESSCKNDGMKARNSVIDNVVWKAETIEWSEMVSTIICQYFVENSFYENASIMTKSNMYHMANTKRFTICFMFFGEQ